MRCSITAIAILCLSFCTATQAQWSRDSLSAQLQALEHRLHVEPVAVLQELQAAQPLLAEADITTRLWYQLRLAQVHMDLFMYDEVEQDVAYAQEIQTADSPGLLVTWITALQGVAEHRQGNFDRGIALLEAAAEQARHREEDRLYVFVVAELAFVRGVLEHYGKSLADLQRAHRVASRLGDPELMAMVNDAFGAVYGYQEDYPRSLEYYQLALKDYEMLGYKAQMASAIQGLATSARYAGDSLAAEKYFKQYLETTSYASGKYQEFYGNYGLGMTYAEAGNCGRALPQLELTLAMVGPADFKAELLKHQAVCEAERGNLAAADIAQARAVEILEAIPELAGTTWMLTLQRSAAMVEYYRGDTKRAFELLKHYHEAYLELAEHSTSARMSTLRADLESNRKDLEIALLEEQAQVNQLQTETQYQENRFQRYVIGLWVIISAIILGGLLVQRRNNRRALALSNIDGLSGLYNHRYIFDYLEGVIPKISQGDAGLAILLLDLDNFKQVNDRYGHPMGDQVIRRMAEIGRASLRDRDLMGRIGGEEFLCLLPRATAEQALQVASRLLQAIGREEFVAADGSKFSVTVSIGIANYTGADQSAEQLYKEADQALYAAKSAGKNCISTYSPE